MPKDSTTPKAVEATKKGDGVLDGNGDPLVPVTGTAGTPTVRPSNITGPHPHPALELGNASESVRHLKGKLNERYGVELPDNDTFDKQTLERILDLQANNHLSATGRVDEATWALLCP